MGSRRSRKAKAREQFNYQIDEVFERIAAEREGRSVRIQKDEQSGTRKESKKKPQKDNPNHPCYKCIGCPHWTKCPGYSQFVECLKQRRKAYEEKIASIEQGLH